MSNVLMDATPTPLELRAMLQEMALNELRGPVGGESEEVDERIRDRYLVGMLAPRKRPNFAADGDFPPDDEVAVDGVRPSEGGDDGPVENAPAPSKTIFPSSIGLSFSVDLSASSILATPTWGYYERTASETLTNEKSGTPKKIWKRIPCGGEPIEITLADDERIDIRIGDHSFPDAAFKGRVRRRSTHWSVTLFLVNEAIEPDGPNRERAWMFQCGVEVAGSEHAPIFQKRLHQVNLSGTEQGLHEENEMLSMLYRRHVEFAVGHGVAVHAEPDPNESSVARSISTRTIPTYEVPKTTPPTVADGEPDANDPEKYVNSAFKLLDGLVLDMKDLSDTPQKQFRKKLQPLTDAYKEWIKLEEAKINDPAEGLEQFDGVAAKAIASCKRTLERIQAGIDLIESDEQVCQAFQFMNRAMWWQRTRSIFAEQVRRDAEDADYNQVDIPKNRSWYPFQLAFVILNLQGIADLNHKDRSDSPDAIADLLWFPTGGGKTEAYLGLTAFTLGIRRLQGTVAGRSGDDGVAVLMRYTLRLLTLQQFQRASALICACEMIRREAAASSNNPWGNSPFRIGLWVGNRATPGRTVDAEEALKSTAGPGVIKKGGSFGGSGSPHVLTCCPWCGSKIEFSTRNYQIELMNKGRGRTFVFCGDKTGQCAFGRRKSPDEGLPIVVVDEEIYRLLPSLLIATVDKFAQMPWKGQTQMLFGQVNESCERHGFKSPEDDDANSHPATRDGRFPSAKTNAVNPLRPPDLIIQDELHLISGPLGTLVGLYETAIDRLCTWEVDGKPVRPKVIASTATIRQAKEQVSALFMRDTNVFPPNGLDVGDNFFSLQRPSTEPTPGRLYVGVCASGRRLRAAVNRVYVAYMAAAQTLYEKYGNAADPWMTLVGYFNSIRELGGMRRMVDDTVYTRLRRMQNRGLANRNLHIPYSIQELTSRLGSTAIPKTLDRLEYRFDPNDDEERRRKAKAKSRDIKPWPVDVLLATNMISVGVDVPRLGLMVCNCQPKTTSEYIQATSRVGRRHPGLVVTAYNWARPRDLSHYETFEHYHATFYQHVEALSVTPFSDGSIRRGLAALLVSLVRLRGVEFNANESAARVGSESSHPYIQEAIEWIVKRSREIGNEAISENVRLELEAKVQAWEQEALMKSGGARLGYRSRKDGETIGLLESPGDHPWDEFTCLNSLRDVEPTALLIMDDHHLDDDADFAESTDSDGNGEGDDE